MVVKFDWNNISLLAEGKEDKNTFEAISSTADDLNFKEAGNNRTIENF